jgi:hypothetical protein
MNWFFNFIIMEKEKKVVTISEDAWVALAIAIEDAKQSLGKKCEHCDCYGGIHKSDCLFILRLP